MKISNVDGTFEVIRDVRALGVRLHIEVLQDKNGDIEIQSITSTDDIADIFSRDQISQIENAFRKRGQ